MLSDARERGAVRLVDVLEHDEVSLVRIIDGLDALDTSSGDRIDQVAQAQAPKRTSR
jgi:hypothetical protein